MTNKSKVSRRQLILTLIETVQSNDDIRGPTFELICKTLCDYDENQLMRLLREMVENEEIASTGFLKNKKYSLLLFAKKAEDEYDNQLNNFIFPSAAANGVNLYKSFK